MKRIALMVLALAGLMGRADAAPSRTLDVELKTLLDTVSDAIEKDVALRGRTLSLGLIASQDRPDANYGGELRRLFTLRLKNRLVADGILKMHVSYDFTTSDSDVAAGAPVSNKMKVLLISVIIKDDKRKELFNKSVEINESSDIAKVMGLTVEPPPNGTQYDRNDAVKKAYELNQNKEASQIQPTYSTRGLSQIGIPGRDRFFVELHVKDQPQGATRPITPTPNSLGNAFVDIKAGQFYEIVVYNYDDYDAVARISIDGQDALNRFNADKVEYPGLLVAKGKSARLRGWMHTVKPRSAEKDNVFAFSVKEYAYGSEAPVKATGEVGVICVQFAVAWKEGESRPAGRSVGRSTDKGPGLEEKFELVPRHIGEFNETIHVRYSPTAK